MNAVPADHAIILAAALFALGVLGVLARRDFIFVLMSLEIMLNAAVVAFVAAAYKWGQPDGQVVVLFILVTAAAEVSVGLTLLLRVYANWKTVDVDEVSTMKG